VPELREIERPAQVVRQEERREGDHDQVVEEQRPTGHEPEQVVERASHERRRAAGLGDRGRSLRVRQRDEEEEHAREQQHDGRQAERLRNDDAEREVERRGDLVVGDREQRGRLENAFEPAQLPCH
jgi:hypothetical protein